MADKISGIALRPFLGDEGQVRRGQRIEVDSRRSKDLEARKLFQPDVVHKKREPEPKNKAEAAAPRNRAESPTGGQTGEAITSSSLPQGRPPLRRR